MQWDVAHRFNLLTRRTACAAMVTTGGVLVNGQPVASGSPESIDAPALIRTFGADALRFSLAYMAPVNRAFERDDRYVAAAAAWLARLERVATSTGMAAPRDLQGLEPAALALRRRSWLTLASISARYQRLEDLNEVTAKIMTIVGQVESAAAPQAASVHKEMMYLAVIALWPVAPATCERIWQQFVAEPLLAAGWPVPPAGVLDPLVVELAVEVDGQVRGRIEVRPGAGRDEVQARALALKNVQRYLAARQPRKIVFIADKLINFVVN